jgi:hypothetical protein
LRVHQWGWVEVLDRQLGPSDQRRTSSLVEVKGHVLKALIAS